MAMSDDQVQALINEYITIENKEARDAFLENYLGHPPSEMLRGVFEFGRVIATGMTSGEIAETYGLSRASVHRMVKKGEFPAPAARGIIKKKGNWWYWDRAEIKTWWAERQAAN